MYESGSFFFGVLSIFQKKKMVSDITGTQTRVINIIAEVFIIIPGV